VPWFASIVASLTVQHAGGEHNADVDSGGDRPFRLLLVLLVAAGAFFGLAPLLAPTAFASRTGFAGTDVFLYRLAGAASAGYAVGLAAALRAGWDRVWIPIAATLVFNVASIVACVIAIAAGAQPVVLVILAASVLFTAGTGYFLLRPPPSRLVLAANAAARGPGPRIAVWVVALFAVGTLAAAFFGIVPLVLGGEFGRLLGYSGNDDFVYRQGAAATLGAAVGGLLVLRSRTWAAARIPAMMATTFNGLATIAALVEIAGGGQPIAWVILAAAGLTTIGMVVALVRGGR
jgi:hypothetical protein